MRAAAAAGAQVIELDVHLTPDNVFAVFHDWTVDCRTNGQGVTEKIPFTTLVGLDVGYGYTTDDVSYPLRGTGVGLMPSLSQVLDADIGAQFLINFKSKRANEGTMLAKLLTNADYASQIYGVYGGSEPTNAALSIVPELRGFDRPALKECLIAYALTGWTTRVPVVCRDRIVAVPMDYGRYLWGWPHKFTRRMQAAGSDVILWGPYDGTGFSSGVDDAGTWGRVPDGFDGHVWTNKVEVIGPLRQNGL